MRASSSSTYEAKVAALLPPPEIAMPTSSSPESGWASEDMAPSTLEERSAVGAAHADNRRQHTKGNDAVRMRSAREWKIVDRFSGRRRA
jgi:hypothetical protein